MNPLSVVASFFREGGPFMFIILGVGVVIMAIVLERMAVIGRAAAINSRKMTDDLVRNIGKGDVAKARTVSGKSKAPVARVAQAILRTPGSEESKLQTAADDEASIVLPPLTRRLGFLNTLANVATLLGLLGTIFGLTTAFSAVGAADPSQRSAFLAAGISQALNTTAFGLIIAVPTLLIHGWLVGLVEGIGESVDELSIRLCQAMSRRDAAAQPHQVLPMHGNRAATGNWDDGVR